MRAFKLTAIVSVVVLNVGCARISDIENLQVQIDSLKPRVTNLVSDATSAKVTAVHAVAKATNAEAASNRSAMYLREVYDKLFNSWVCIKHK